VTVIEQILDRHQIEAQGYPNCQNILSGLGKPTANGSTVTCVGRESCDGPQALPKNRRQQATPLDPAVGASRAIIPGLRRPNGRAGTKRGEGPWDD
jgi:hypothetical protein